jgi:lactoylglutathione lyase
MFRQQLLQRRAMTDSSNVEQAVPLYSVHDIQASLRFYVDGLGFRKTREWVDEGTLRWCWLELGTAAVMLQEWWKEGSHRNVPTTPVGIGVTINFICRDALALYREFRSRGIQAKRPFVGNSMWVTEVNDPDGYALFFESPTEVTEGTEYTE